LTERAVSNSFSQDVPQTIGASFRRFNCGAFGQEICLNIWDTAGQDDFRTLVPIYFKGAELAMVVFALNKRDSFEHVRDWVQTLEEKADVRSFCLIGNKKDLDREVQTEEGTQLAREISASFYLETSALLGQNVREAFEDLAKQICEEKAIAASPTSRKGRTDSNTVNLSERSSKHKKCC
jgi:small GTP-binding protein